MDDPLIVRFSSQFVNKRQIFASTVFTEWLPVIELYMSKTELYRLYVCFKRVPGT